LLRVPSNLALNVSRDGASTTSLGNHLASIAVRRPDLLFFLLLETFPAVCSLEIKPQCRYRRGDSAGCSAPEHRLLLKDELQSNYQPGTSATLGTGCLGSHVRRTLLLPHYNPCPSLPLPAFVTAGQADGDRQMTTDKDFMWQRKGGGSGSAKGK